MGRFSNSVALAKSSWAVLKMDRELMVIPVMSFIATLITTVLMGTAVFISLKEQAPAKVSANLQPIVGDATFNGTTLGPTPVTYVLGFVGYLLVTLLKQTWGENLIAQGGLGVLSFLVMAAGLVVAGAIFTVAPIAGIILFIVWVAVASTVIATLNGIYRTALYLYASGQPVAWFDEQVLAGAFRPRTGVLS